MAGTHQSEGSTAPRTRFPYPVVMAFLAIAIFAAARFGLLFAFEPRDITLVWAPSGIALAAVVFFGYRVWPGIALGILLTALTSGWALPGAVADVIANTLEALVGVFILRRVFDFRPRLERLRDVVGVAVTAIAVGAAGGAIGTAGLLVSGQVDASSVSSAWWVWSLGDILGIVIVGQFILAWGSSSRLEIRPARVLEAAGLLAGLLIVSQITIGTLIPGSLTAPRAYLGLPLLIWAASRFGARGASTASLLVSALAVWYTVHGVGPYAGNDPDTSAALLAGFLIVTSVTTQALAAMVAERQAAEGSSRGATETFHAVVEASPIAITAVDLAGRIIIWNAAAERTYGWAANEVMGGPLPHIPPQEAHHSRNLVERALRGERVASVESRRLRRDGSLVEVDIAAAPIVDSGGAVVGVLALSNDITERKRAEIAVRESEERFRQLAEGIDEIFWLVAADGTTPLYISPTYEAITGRSRAEAFAHGQLFLDLAHPDDRSIVIAAIGRSGALDFQSDLEYRIVRPDGRIRWLRGRSWPVHDEHGRIIRIGGLTADVTEHRLAEEALRDSNATLQAILKASPVGISVIDLERRVRLWSPANERIFGWTAQEVVGHPSPTVPDDPRDPSRLAIQRALFGLTVTDFEAQRRRKDGTAIDLTFAAAPMRNEDGSITGVLVLTTDITDRKRLEAQLIQADKMQSVGRLAGGVAHDFNNLLTAIRGYSDLLLEDLTHESPGRSDVEAIRQAADRAASLTSQLLAFSRRQVLAPEVLDINRVVAGVEPMLGRLIGEDVTLRTNLETDSGWVSADEGQLEQVIVNLAVNARDAMPHGGTLVVETASVELDGAYARRHLGVTPGPYVRLTVIDTGLGLDEATKSRIFEPFFTTKERGKGTGLGLAMVYGTVRQSGGHITVDSEPGQGTTFRVHLPQVEPPEEERRAREVEPVPAGGSETLLLVEDDSAVRELTSAILRRYGYTVLVANDATEALAITRGPDAPCVDLLVTDVVMPGLSGRELAELLTASRPDLLVLYVSGYTDDQIVRHGVLEPGVAFLPKPFTPEALARRVRDILGARPAEAF